MKELTKHRTLLRGVSIFVILIYLITFMLNLTGFVNISTNPVILLITFVSVILQAVIFLTGIKEESDSSGRNLNFNLLLVWIMILVFVLF